MLYLFLQGDNTLFWWVYITCLTFQISLSGKQYANDHNRFLQFQYNRIFTILPKNIGISCLNVIKLKESLSCGEQVVLLFFYLVQKIRSRYNGQSKPFARVEKSLLTCPLLLYNPCITFQNIKTWKFASFFPKSAHKCYGKQNLERFACQLIFMDIWV